MARGEEGHSRGLRRPGNRPGSPLRPIKCLAEPFVVKDARRRSPDSDVPSLERSPRFVDPGSKLHRQVGGRITSWPLRHFPNQEQVRLLASKQSIDVVVVSRRVPPAQREVAQIGVRSATEPKGELPGSCDAKSVDYRGIQSDRAPQTTDDSDEVEEASVVILATCLRVNREIQRSTSVKAKIAGP